MSSDIRRQLAGHLDGQDVPLGWVNQVRVGVHQYTGDVVVVLPAAVAADLAQFLDDLGQQHDMYDGDHTDANVAAVGAVVSVRSALTAALRRRR